MLSKWYALLTNRPFLRLYNYFTDGPFWQKRWRYAPYYTAKNALHIHADVTAVSKLENPNWRKEWRWVLLRVDDNLQKPYTPLFFVNEVTAIPLRRPICTPLFAMRVGDGPRKVAVLDANKHYRVPVVCGEGGLRVAADVRQLALELGKEVSFI